MTINEILNNVIDELERTLDILNICEEAKEIALGENLIQDIEKSIERLNDII